MEIRVFMVSPSLCCVLTCRNSIGTTYKHQWQLGFGSPTLVYSLFVVCFAGLSCRSSLFVYLLLFGDCFTLSRMSRKTRRIAFLGEEFLVRVIDGIYGREKVGS